MPRLCHRARGIAVRTHRSGQRARVHAGGLSESTYRKAPPEAGLSLSRPVSRILSLSSHPSERPTWTSAGSLQTVLFGLASGGVCPAAASPRRWCALTAPFHPCRPAVHVGRRTLAVCFCGTFPRVSPGRSLDHPALRCPDFPRRPEGPPRLPGLPCQRSAGALACEGLPTLAAGRRGPRWNAPVRRFASARRRGRAPGPLCCGSAPWPRSRAAGGCDRSRGRSA